MGGGGGRRVLEVNGLQESDLWDIVDIKEDVRKHRQEQQEQTPRSKEKGREICPPGRL